MIKQKTAFWVLLIVMLTGCGGDEYPVLTNFKFINDKFTTTIDTSDPSQLIELSALFYDRKEVTGEGEALDFKYLVEISRDGNEERWRCSVAGFCRLYITGVSPIYKLERHIELYQKASISGQ